MEPRNLHPMAYVVPNMRGHYSYLVLVALGLFKGLKQVRGIVEDDPVCTPP